MGKSLASRFFVDVAILVGILGIVSTIGFATYVTKRDEGRVERISEQYARIENPVATETYRFETGVEGESVLFSDLDEDGDLDATLTTRYGTPRARDLVYTNSPSFSRPTMVSSN